MNRSGFVLAGVIFTLIIFGFLSPDDACAQETTWTGWFHKVTHAGDEFITITYKDDNGDTQTLMAQTGEAGSDNKEDDLPKDMTGADKAGKIAAAINNAEGNGGNVLATHFKAGGEPTNIVHVTTTGSNKGVTKVKVTNNTRQKKNKKVIDKPSKASGHQESFIYLMGIVSGRDDDGNPAEISVGTEHYECVKSPGTSMTTEQLAREMVQDLVRNEVSASLVLPTVIRIVLDDERDMATVYGCSDVGLSMTVETVLVSD